MLRDAYFKIKIHSNGVYSVFTYKTYSFIKKSASHFGKNNGTIFLVESVIKYFEDISNCRSDIKRERL